MMEIHFAKQRINNRRAKMMGTFAHIRHAHSTTLRHMLKVGAIREETIALTRDSDDDQQAIVFVVWETDTNGSHEFNFRRHRRYPSERHIYLAACEIIGAKIATHTTRYGHDTFYGNFLIVNEDWLRCPALSGISRPTLGLHNGLVVSKFEAQIYASIANLALEERKYPLRIYVGSAYYKHEAGIV